MTLLPILWQWFARMGAPILAAFLVGQYVAGRNCEESKLREEIAALKAASETQERLNADAEARRLESEKRLSDDISAYRKALQDAVKSDKRLGDCLGVPLPASLRIPPVVSLPVDPE